MLSRTVCCWLYCPGHAVVKGNDQAHRLAGKATLTGGSLLRRSEVLRSLRHYLQVQGHHTTDCLEQRGVERGSARLSTMEGQARAIFNQTNDGTVSKTMLGKPLRQGGAYVGFSERIDTILNWTVCFKNLAKHKKVWRVGFQTKGEVTSYRWGNVQIHIKFSSCNWTFLFFTKAISKLSPTCTAVLPKTGPLHWQANGCPVFQNQLSFLIRCPQKER